MDKKISGILVAIATPFTDDGSAIDEERLKAHINHLISAGVHGLVAGGTTGEFTAMSLKERKSHLQMVIKHTAERIPVIAGTGALNTKDALHLASHAAQAGAAAVMVVPPFYDPVDYTQLRELLLDISTTSKIPIMFYNLPSVSGITLTPHQLASLSEVGVEYMKDTSGNAPDLTELLFTHDHRLTVFNGWDSLTFYGLAAGAKGSVWGASNIIPELSVKLWQTVAIEHDLVQGRELWRKIYPICKFLESHHYASAVKTGMEILGFRTGGLRKPFQLLGEDDRLKLRALLLTAGLNVVDNHASNC